MFLSNVQKLKDNIGNREFKLTISDKITWQSGLTDKADDSSVKFTKRSSKNSNRFIVNT
jgi:hypothetical protein